MSKLFPVKSLFWLGSYQLAYTEANRTSVPSEELKAELNAYSNRCLIAMGNGRPVLEMASESDPPPVQATTILAQYIGEEGKEKAIESLEAAVADPEKACPVLKIIASIIYAREGKLEQALRILHKDEGNLEMLSARVDVLLKMHRVDLAERELKNMQKLDDDSPLTQITAVWVDLSVGGPRYEEAGYVLEELIGKYGGSPLLLNAQACVKMSLGRFEEAERTLLDALAKDPTSPDTLQNLVVVNEHLGKSDAAKKFMATLKGNAPEHSFLSMLDAAETGFDVSKDEIKG